MRLNQNETRITGAMKSMCQRRVSSFYMHRYSLITRRAECFDKERRFQLKHLLYKVSDRSQATTSSCHGEKVHPQLLKETGKVEDGPALRDLVADDPEVHGETERHLPPSRWQSQPIANALPVHPP